MVVVRWTKDTVSRPHLLGLLDNQLGGGRLGNSRIDGLTTMLQIRTVTMLAARDNGVNTCNLRRYEVNGSGNGDWG